VDQDFYVLMQRKGWQRPGWHEVVQLQDKNLSPLHLLLRMCVYVSHQAPCGGPVLLYLNAPFKPLTGDRIGSLTKTLLKKLGVPTQFYGPHSTRGAAVRMFKELGVSSEYVCELGKWKNQGAFASHYLRLGAAKVASKILNPLVHNVSPSEGAEPEQSRTPGTEDQGGSDWEGEAPKLGEPTHPPLNFIFFQRW